MSIRRIYLFVFLLVSLAACAQPGGRIKLTQLEQAPLIDGSRIAMIGLTNAAGDQRYAFYVNVGDTCIDYTPTATGNSVVSIFVQKCSTDSIWYIDWEGLSILLAPHGGGAVQDQDWLEIGNNQVPDNINDSIYTYRYASVGARLVWPEATFLVNDSSANGALQIIQGDRTAMLGLYDGTNETWSALLHGGATILYIPNDGNFHVSTSGGTPQTPAAPQVDHFVINTQDSTVQINQYPNTRVDTNAVENVLYTDPLGVIRSTTPADMVAAGLSMPNQEVVSGTGTGITSSADFTHNISGNAVNIADTVNTTRPVRANVPSNWYYRLLGRPDLGFLTQHTLSDPVSLTQASVAYNNWNIGITTSASTETSAPGLRFYKAMVDGSGNAQVPTAGQRLTTLAIQSHRGQTTSLFDFYNQTNGAFFLQVEVDSVGSVGEISTITGLYAKPITTSSPAPSGYRFLYGRGNGDIYLPAYNTARDDPGSGAVFLSVDGSNRLTAHPVSSLGGGTIYTDTGTVAAIPDFLVRTRSDTTFSLAETNTDGWEDFWNTYDSGDYFSGSFISRGYWNGIGFVQVSVDSNLYSGIEIKDNPQITITSSSNPAGSGNGYTATIKLFGYDIGGAGDLGGRVQISGQVSDQGYNYLLAAETPSTVLGDTTVMAWAGDGASANPVGFLPYNHIPDGTFNADQLSYQPANSGFIPVTANRVNFLVGTGTITPSESITEIAIDTAATTSTINLNFTPDVRYNYNFTTVRYIYNWGSGNCTVQTNQSWRFKTSTTTATTLTISPGEAYKLIWRSDTSPQRFYCFRIQ